MHSDEEILRAKINLETARIAWKNLQFFFASGNAIKVSADLDLVDVAMALSQDNKPAVANWMETEKLAAVTNVLARRWYQEDAILWAVVVRPWVLVQER